MRLCDSIGGMNAYNVLCELALGIRNVIDEHVLTLTVSERGALRLLADISAYQRFFTDLLHN